MSVKYFPKDVNDDGTCDGSNTPLDMNKTQGSSTGQSSSGTQSSSFVEVMSFDIDVSGDNPVNSSHNVSIDLTGITDATCRFRLQALTAGCSITASSVYSAEFSTTGVKTFSVNLSWGGSDVRLRLSCEIKKDASHGNKTIDLNVNDADTFVDSLSFTPPSAGGQPSQIRDGYPMPAALGFGPG